MRYYSSTAAAVDLTAPISNSATTLTVSSTTGFPGTTPYTLVIDPDQATEEIVEVTNVSGLTLTVTRGVDGSSAQAHSAGVSNVRHMATARDYREPQEHIAASTNVHGLTGGSAVVGTDTVQTLKNKTALAASAATTGLVVKGTAAQSAAYLDVQDSTGATAVKVQPGNGTLTLPSTVAMNEAVAATANGYVARFTTSAVAVVGGIFKRIAGQTADLLQVQSEAGAVLAKFDKDGNLTAPAVSTAGAVTADSVTAATGAFSGAVSTGALTPASVASAGAVSGTTGTFSGAVSGTTGTFSGNIAAANAVTAAGGLRVYVASVTPANTNASGFVTVTHGCPFTPLYIVAQIANPTASFAVVWGVESLTATTCSVRYMNASSAGAFASGTPGATRFICFG